MASIRFMRKLRKITQMELAAMVGVTQSAVCQWETGAVKPTQENLIAIANALGCKVDDLIKEVSA